MAKSIRLTSAQWKVLVSAFSNMGQAIILFSLAALFVPEIVNLTHEFSRIYAIIFLLGGLALLISSVLTARKGK